MSSHEEKEKSLTLDAKFLLNTISLVDAVIEIIGLIEADGKKPGVSAGLLTTGKNILSGHDSREAIDTFILRTYEHWPDIKAKKDSFLREYITKSMFEEFAMAKVLLSGLPAFLDMITKEESLATFGNRAEIDECVDDIWAMMCGSVTLSIKFIDEERCPQMVEQKDGTMKRTYTKKAYPGISVKKEKEKWEME